MTAATTTKLSEQASLEKRSLASILRDHGPLSVVDAVDVTLDVCDELANAHANGVVHGDLGLHRVRTVWPRVAGQRVDIFALGEDDSAAFAFRTSNANLFRRSGGQFGGGPPARASAASILVAPEQRDGRVVDVRADVWAVGAILHWLIAGIPPTNDPVSCTLFGKPRALVATIASCLEADPSRRPQSIDEVVQAIGSYAASPPERFEQLARRRVALENAKHVRKDIVDVDRVLGRLDDAALEREVTAASFAGPLPTADPLVIAVRRGMKSAVFEKATPFPPLHDNDGARDVETVLAQPTYEPEAKRASDRHQAQALTTPQPINVNASRPVAPKPKLLAPKQKLANVRANVRQQPPVAPPSRRAQQLGAGVAQRPAGAKLDDLDELEAETVLAQPPLSIAPVVLSSELLGPPRDLPSAPPHMMMPSPSMSPSTTPMMMPTRPLLHVVGPRPQSHSLQTVFIVFGAIAAIAIGIGIGMRLMSHRVATAATTATTTTTAQAATPPVAAAPPAAAGVVTPGVVTPSSLPDVTPASLPDVRTTPASLPNAPVVRAPAPVAPAAAARPKAPAAASGSRESAPAPEAAAEASPNLLSDALR